MRARTFMLAAAVLAAGVTAAPARALFGPPVLLTSSPLEQSDGVGSSTLSADGRYLVFSGSLDGVRGVLRRDLQTGLIQVVAAADAYGDNPIVDARDPSISANGRYISFTTGAGLDPTDDHNNAVDVYVRDMEASVPADGAPCDAVGPCAYTLVSALDGTTAGMTYASPYGSVAAPRQAMSADGRRVVFVVQADSNLVGPNTPGGQVAVRDLDTRRTMLVSSERDAATGTMTGQPVPGGAVAGQWAVLSADGTTVVWSGGNIRLQTALVNGDPAGTSTPYNEPLWRRIADGPSAPTRRVAGAGDPEAPGCPPGGTMEDPACQGPYPDLGNNANDSLGLQGGWLSRPGAVPSVSADGRTVAFLGGPPVLPYHTPSEGTDLFVADMHEGISRRTAVRRLTQDPTGDVLTDLGIAPDGRKIAFATNRTAFALSPPFLISTPPAQPGLQELWLVDLDGQTLQRLSRTVDGGPASLPSVGPGLSGGPMSPSFDATGRMVAFDSLASNLVAVDANNATDAFLVEDRTPPAGTPGRVDITPPPAAQPLPRAWRLALRGVAQRDGSVRLDADLPGAGVLRVTVRAIVPVSKRVTVKRRGGGHTVVRRRVLSKRQVAVASTVARTGGLTRLAVRVTKAYRSLVAGKAGLDATAEVTFAAPSRATLRDALAVHFRIVPVKTTKKPSAKSKTKLTKAKAKR